MIQKKIGVNRVTSSGAQMAVCHLFIFLKYRVCSFLLYSVMFCNREFSVH